MKSACVGVLSIINSKTFSYNEVNCQTGEK